MQVLKKRLDALEAIDKAPSLCSSLLPPGCKHLSALILRGPNEQVELDHARALGFIAELDTPEEVEKFL